MKVLLLSQVLPYPPDSGPKVKTYNVVKYLGARHRLVLVSFVRGNQSRDVEHLRRHCEAVHTVPMERGAVRDAMAMARSLVTGRPWMMIRDQRADMRALVKRVSQEFEPHVVHADQLNMYQYAARVSGAFKILDAHNALWLLYRRLWETMQPGPRKWLLGRDWGLLKEYEGTVVRTCDAVLAVSEEDKLALQDAGGEQVDMAVIPIAIDTGDVQLVERAAEPNHVLHIGTMYWPPNIDAVVWFLQEMYPLIRRARPDVQFDVVGSRPPRQLLAIARSGVGVNVTGYVADPTPYLQQAAVMVVPVRAGGGMRVKILNALAEGIPIVSTSLGFEGIALRPGEHILVGDTPETFAAAVLQVLNDPDLGRRLAANGRRLAEQMYDYRVACRPLDEVYARAARRAAEPNAPRRA